jgi:Protein of unknown function (DUF1523)
MKKFLLIAIPALLIIGSLFTNAPYQWLTQRSIEQVLVKDKQVTTESTRKENKVESTYLIYTDQGVFRNDDAGWFMKYNSSDVYGNLDVGKRYRFKVYGWRIPFFSMYPNLVRAEEVKPATPAK